MNSKSEEYLGREVGSRIAYELEKVLHDWLSSRQVPTELKETMENAVLSVLHFKEIGCSLSAEIMGGSPKPTPNLRNTIRNVLCDRLNDHFRRCLTDEHCDRAVAFFLQAKRSVISEVVITKD